MESMNTRQPSGQSSLLVGSSLFLVAALGCSDAPPLYEGMPDHVRERHVALEVAVALDQLCYPRRAIDCVGQEPAAQASIEHQGLRVACFCARSTGSVSSSCRDVAGSSWPVLTS